MPDYHQRSDADLLNECRARCIANPTCGAIAVQYRYQCLEYNRVPPLSDLRGYAHGHSGDVVCWKHGIPSAAPTTATTPAPNRVPTRVPAWPPDPVLTRPPTPPPNSRARGGLTWTALPPRQALLAT